MSQFIDFNSQFLVTIPYSLDCDFFHTVSWTILRSRLFFERLNFEMETEILRSRLRPRLPFISKLRSRFLKKICRFKIIFTFETTNRYCQEKDSQKNQIFKIVEIKIYSRLIFFNC